MTKNFLQEALRLPAEARATLAGRLLESLDGPVDEDAEAAWSDEIAHRMDDLDFALLRPGSGRQSGDHGQ